jgi:hypothetical protein
MKLISLASDMSTSAAAGRAALVAGPVELACFCTSVDQVEICKSKRYSNEFGVQFPVEYFGKKLHIRTCSLLSPCGVKCYENNTRGGTILLNLPAKGKNKPLLQALGALDAHVKAFVNRCTKKSTKPVKFTPCVRNASRKPSLTLKIKFGECNILGRDNAPVEVSKLKGASLQAVIEVTHIYWKRSNATWSVQLRAVQIKVV